MNPRLLILGYYFPDANMGGVRLRRIARHLPRHGWEPVVLTHSPAATPETAATDRVRVETVAAPDLTRWYERLRPGRRRCESAGAQPAPTAKSIGLTSQLNRWLMVPDKQVAWYRAAVRRGRELLRAEKFSAIFASLDPRTSLLVAARLSRETGIPCVLEYRDLWTGSPYYHVTQPTRFHRWLHLRLERKALRQAARVTALCRGIADYLSRTHATVLRAPVAVNYNFFDPAEYPAPTGARAQSRPFTIAYTGALYAERSPHQFFEGMRLFIDQEGLSPAQFQFRWAGGAAGIGDLGEVLDRTGVRPYLDFVGQVPHREALRLLQHSDATLLIQAPEDTIHIPGKLFEALGARVPVLALAHPCEVTEIITRCRAGIACPHTAASVAAALTEFRRCAAQGRPWPFAEAEVQRWSAMGAVSRLGKLLEQAIG